MQHFPPGEEGAGGSGYSGRRACIAGVTGHSAEARAGGVVQAESGSAQRLIPTSPALPNLPPRPGRCGENLRCQPPLEELWTQSEGCGHRGRGLRPDPHERGGWGVARCEDCRPSSAPCGVGQAGAGPQAFAFPTHSPANIHRDPQHTPGCTEVPGPRAVGRPRGGRWKGSCTTSSQGPQSRSPCKWVDPRSSALRRRLGQMF